MNRNTKSEIITFQGKSGKEIHARAWDRLPLPKAGVLILHGMGEHGARYEEFASFLNRNGYAVYAPDHRGHGLTAKSLDTLGHNGPDGFNRSVDDAYLLFREIQRRDPGIPLFLFGHSFGSFLAQEYITRYGKEIAGVILSGSGKMDQPEIAAGRLLAKVLKTVRKENHPSPFLTGLAYAGYNKRVSRRSGEFDWLSRDAAEVLRYEQDPYCGPIFSTGFFYYFLRGLCELYRPRKLARIPKTLPVFLIAGGSDPVGSYGKKVVRLEDLYHDLKLSDVRCKLYPEARHELLHETNRTEVMDDILAWMEQRLK